MGEGKILLYRKSIKSRFKYNLNLKDITSHKPFICPWYYFQNADLDLMNGKKTIVIFRFFEKMSAHGFAKIIDVDLGEITIGILI